MLVWVTLVAGSLVIVGGVLVIARVDRRWRRAHLQCCRCLEVWFGHDKLCERCSARGHDYDWLARQFAGFPTHDWQGYLDTGPIPVITVPQQRPPAPAPAPVPAPMPPPSWSAGPVPQPAAAPDRSQRV